MVDEVDNEITMAKKLDVTFLATPDHEKIEMDNSTDEKLSSMDSILDTKPSNEDIKSRSSFPETETLAPSVIEHGDEASSPEGSGAKEEINDDEVQLSTFNGIASNSGDHLSSDNGDVDENDSPGQENGSAQLTHTNIEGKKLLAINFFE